MPYRFGDGSPSRPGVKLIKSDPDAGPEGAPGDDVVSDRLNRQQLPHRFNNGSCFDAEGAQDDRPAAFNDPDQLGELMCQMSNLGTRYGAGDDEAVRPGEADPGG